MRAEDEPIQRRREGLVSVKATYLALPGFTILIYISAFISINLRPISSFLNSSLRLRSKSSSTTSPSLSLSLSLSRQLPHLHCYKIIHKNPTFSQKHAVPMSALLMAMSNLNKTFPPCSLLIPGPHDGGPRVRETRLRRL